MSHNIKVLKLKIQILQKRSKKAIKALLVHRTRVTRIILCLFSPLFINLDLTFLAIPFFGFTPRHYESFLA
jgi:hypothetical protein